MKRKTFYIAICFLAMLLTFVGCQTPVQIPKDDSVYVTILDAEGISVEKTIATVKRGNDLTFDFTVEEGYLYDTCVYAGEYNVQETANEGRYTVTLSNVKYDMRFCVKAKIDNGGDVVGIPGKICYALNGGKFIDETMTGNFFTQDIVLEHHLRLNTDIGTSFARYGYTQLGWNTKADGSGEHIGLGSRVTVSEEDALVLYAEWSKWADPTLFTYAKNHTTKETGDIVLKEYLGAQTVETLSIPGYIEDDSGKRWKVTYIGEDFSSGLNIQTLVFPNTLDTVKVGSFEKSTISEIYFYDNVMNISDGAFECIIPKVHINAIQPPRWIGVNNRSHFADDMDRLIMNADKKKMILFGGCSMSYGVYSYEVEEAFNNEYTLCNMAVNGGTNGYFQFLCMLPYIKEGDIFLHAPEQMSPYQLLDKLRAEDRIFALVGTNYDLLANIDLSRITAFFECFTTYNKTRMLLPASNYQAYNADYNEYGDIVKDRPNSEEGAYFGLETTFEMEYLSEEAFANLNDIYGRMEAQGASVLFSFAPLNKEALTEENIQTQNWLVFENAVKAGLDPAFPVISSAYDYLFEGKYFYDTDYHLSSEGAEIRTQLLIRDLKAALGE